MEGLGIFIYPGNEVGEVFECVLDGKVLEVLCGEVLVSERLRSSIVSVLKDENFSLEVSRKLETESSLFRDTRTSVLSTNVEEDWAVCLVVELIALEVSLGEDSSVGNVEVVYFLEAEPLLFEVCIRGLNAVKPKEAEELAEVKCLRRNEAKYQR